MALALGSVALASTCSAAETRVALVIGNSAYKDSPLRNPANDAADMAAALRGTGFKVTLRTDIARAEMMGVLREFGRSLPEGGVALFYYAGHGIQSQGRNYLIPVDATIKSEAELEFESIDANRVLAYMDEARTRVNIVILDACRNNPFARSFRSASRGLVQMDAGRGTFVAFATAPGSVAEDGDGRNGLYTHHLLQSLKHENTDIDKVFRRVTAAVAGATRGAQVPWVSTSLTGDFYFAARRSPTQLAATSSAPGPAQAVGARQAMGQWDAVLACPSQGGQPAEALRLDVAASGNEFKVKYGAPEQPGSLDLFGEREPDGSMRLSGRGVTTASHFPRGSYFATVTGRFAGTEFRGTGRYDGRECTLSIVRR